MTFVGLDLKDWIQVIGTMGTLLAAIAAWISSRASIKTAKNGEIQINEMKTKNKEEQKPNVFLDQVDVIINFREDGLKTNSPWITNGIDSGEEGLPLTFTNVGPGHALYPTVSLKLETKLLKGLCEAVKGFEDFSADFISDPEGEKEYYLFRYMETMDVIEGTPLKMGTYDLKNDYTQYIDYLFAEKQFTYYLPNTFREILNMAIYSYIYCGIDDEFLPNFKVKISYSDIQQERYEKEIYLALSNFNANADFIDGKRKVALKFMPVNQIRKLGSSGKMEGTN